MDGAEVKERALAEALDSDQRFYTDSLLDIIGGLDYIEMSILAGSAGLPEILIINDVFCMQLLWNTGGETAAVFSSDREVVAEFARVQGRCLSGLESLLAPARPEELRRTNVQLDSYADKRQWLFFNEPPALLHQADAGGPAAVSVKVSFCEKLPNLNFKNSSLVVFLTTRSSGFNCQENEQTLY